MTGRQVAELSAHTALAVLATLAMASQGCGFTIGLDAEATRATATHDGAGVRSVRIGSELGVREMSVSGVDEHFEAVLTTVEWQGPNGPDPNQAVQLDFVLADGQLSPEASGGGPSVTVEALDVWSLRDTPLHIRTDAGELTLDGLSGEVTVDAARSVSATAISGPLTVRSSAGQQIECSGPVDLTGASGIYVSAPTRGSIRSESDVRVVLDDRFEGPLTIDAELAVRVDVAGTDGVTLSLASEVVAITVVVGDTRTTRELIDPGSERHWIDVRGGGPVVEIAGAAPITIVDAPGTRGP